MYRTARRCSVDDTPLRRREQSVDLSLDVLELHLTEDELLGVDSADWDISRPVELIGLVGRSDYSNHGWHYGGLDLVVSRTAGNLVFCCDRFLRVPARLLCFGAGGRRLH
jgi:hypothetical protein